MEILDYKGTVIDAEHFVTLINNARKANKNEWYGFAGNVEGKEVIVKGIGTWLQRFAVGDLYQPGGMDIPVRDFLENLRRPFQK
jgi:hypothetical protein